MTEARRRPPQHQREIISHPMIKRDTIFGFPPTEPKVLIVEGKLKESRYSKKGYPDLYIVAGIIDTSPIPNELKIPIFGLMIADRDSIYEGHAKQLGITKPIHERLRHLVQSRLTFEELYDLSYAVDQSLEDLQRRNQPNPTKKEKARDYDRKESDVIPNNQEVLLETVNIPTDILDKIKYLTPAEQMLIKMRWAGKNKKEISLSLNEQFPKETFNPSFVPNKVKKFIREGLVPKNHPGNPGKRKRK